MPLPSLTSLADVPGADVPGPARARSLAANERYWFHTSAGGAAAPTAPYAAISLSSQAIAESTAATPSLVS
jgi:hypothetical protein